MGKQGDLGISWCDWTFNPWNGCWKISPGCKNCYAAALDHWLGGDNWQRGGPRTFFGDAHWRRPLKWNKEAAEAAAAGRRPRVFCASIADILERHPDPAILIKQEEARERTFELVRNTPNLDWMFLTKRIEEADTTFPWIHGDAKAPHNAWLGVTAEDDEHARRRIPQLQELRPYFAKLFVSYEPAIGEINWDADLLRDIDLVIFGDESGRNRRDANLEWAKRTRDACAQYGSKFHFKQWCGDDVDGVAGKRHKGKIHLPILDGSQHGEMP